MAQVKFNKEEQLLLLFMRRYRKECGQRWRGMRFDGHMDVIERIARKHSAEQLSTKALDELWDIHSRGDIRI